MIVHPRSYPATPKRTRREGPIHAASVGPPEPRRSPDLSILLAWIDAEKAGRNVQAAVETAVKQAQEISSRRRLGWYWQRMSPGVRALIAESHGEGLKRLLGYWDKGGAFQDGLAGLTEREAQAYWLRLRGWSSWLIAEELTPANRRFDRQLWVRVQTVYSLCSKAKAKVLIAFGLPLEGENEEAY